MEIRQISETYSVSPQITADDIAAIKAAGFKSVICNRPDGEHPGQPTAESIRQAAENAGLDFRYIPVVSGALTPEKVAAMAAALKEVQTPVLAYCRSGARSTNLYALLQETAK